MRFNRDGNLLLTASADNAARLWSLDGTLITTFTGHTNDVYTAVFSPDADESYILTTSLDGTVRLWDRDGNEIGALEHPVTGHARWAEFSPDGRYIVTASFDAMSRIWSVDGTLISVLPGHNSDVQMARFSKDGRRIVTASYDATVRQHLVNLDDLLFAAACQTDSRLDPETIEQYEVPEPLLLPAERPEHCHLE